jgi:hypothetical protein
VRHKQTGSPRPPGERAIVLPPCRLAGGRPWPDRGFARSAGCGQRGVGDGYGRPRAIPQNWTRRVPEPVREQGLTWTWPAAKAASEDFFENQQISC